MRRHKWWPIFGLIITTILVAVLSFTEAKEDSVLLSGPTSAQEISNSGKDPGGWDKAKWGMTGNELESSMEGVKKANLTTLQGQPDLTHHIKKALYYGIRSYVRFGFEKGGLVQVIIEVKEATIYNSSSVYLALRKEFGLPSEEDLQQYTSVRTWRFPTTTIITDWWDTTSIPGNILPKHLIIIYRKTI